MSGRGGAAGFEHGTLTAYTKHGCRCDLCREFWNAYMRWWRADQRGHLHGACPTCTCPLPEKPAPTNDTQRERRLGAEEASDG